MAYPALSIACISGCLSKSAIHRTKKKKKSKTKKDFFNRILQTLLTFFQFPKMLETVDITLGLYT